MPVGGEQKLVLTVVGLDRDRPDALARHLRDAQLAEPGIERVAASEAQHAQPGRGARADDEPVTVAHGTDRPLVRPIDVDDQRMLVPSSASRTSTMALSPSSTVATPLSSILAVGPRLDAGRRDIVMAREPHREAPVSVERGIEVTGLGRRRHAG